MKKVDNFDASKWLIENKITTQSRLNENEETKKGTYDVKQSNGINYLYLYPGYDMPEGNNPYWEILTSKDGEIFSSKRMGQIVASLIKNLPSYQQDENGITVSLNDIKSVFSPRQKKKKGTVKINNKYVVKDKESSDEYSNSYKISTKKALEYLSQFDDDEVNAKQFIKDDEGWGEFEQYLENVEQMSDSELEDAMRSEISMYFFSKPDEI